ncbi:MAG: DUF3307 domain-containing protein [Anaerolineales bacterium]
MLLPMIVAHVLGDYQLQFNALARWKARSLWGVVAHGSIVAATHVGLALLIKPSWWPYALLIGITHIFIDVVRTRLLHPRGARAALLWYLADQLLHLTIIASVVIYSGATSGGPYRIAGLLPISWEVLLVLLAYLLLMQPAWVLLRFIVRGLWGTVVPDLGTGEKYEPMLERVLIASFVFLGLPYLVPLVLLPRRIQLQEVRQDGVLLAARLTIHWAETLLSVVLAIMVGVGLRLIVTLY